MLAHWKIRGLLGRGKFSGIHFEYMNLINPSSGPGGLLALAHRTLEKSVILLTKSQLHPWVFGTRQFEEIFFLSLSLHPSLSLSLIFQLLIPNQVMVLFVLDCVKSIFCMLASGQCSKGSPTFLLVAAVEICMDFLGASNVVDVLQILFPFRVRWYMLKNMTVPSQSLR